MCVQACIQPIFQLCLWSMAPIWKVTCDLNWGVLYFKTDDDVSSINVGLFSISTCKSRILIRGGGDRDSFKRVVVDNDMWPSLWSRDELKLLKRFDRLFEDGVVDVEFRNAELESEKIVPIFENLRRCWRFSDVNTFECRCRSCSSLNSFSLLVILCT